MHSSPTDAWLGVFSDEMAPQIGSIFEYTNQRPVFGIIGSDSALYAPILGFFVFTGIPTSVRIDIRTGTVPPVVGPAWWLLLTGLTEELPCKFQWILWFKAVQTANREAEEQDRRDGFL